MGDREECMDYLESVGGSHVVCRLCSGCSISTPPEGSQRLRKKVKLYSIGAFVEVWSAVHQSWMLDGEVARIASESSVENGLQIVAGSTLVIHSNGMNGLWLPPQLVDTHLRPSSRPQAAPPLTGALLEQRHSLSVHWQYLYFELNGGFLQWWENKESAQTGMEPKWFVYLLGLQVQREGQVIHLQAMSAQGVVHTFRCSTEHAAERVESALRAHGDYCQAVYDFSEATARCNSCGKSASGKSATGVRQYGQGSKLPTPQHGMHLGGA